MHEIQNPAEIPAPYIPETHGDWQALVRMQKDLQDRIGQAIQTDCPSLPANIKLNGPHKIFYAAEVAAGQVWNKLGLINEVRENCRPEPGQPFASDQQLLDRLNNDEELSSILAIHRLGPLGNVRAASETKGQRLFVYSAEHQATAFQILSQWLKNGQVTEEQLHGSELTAAELGVFAELALDIGRPGNTIFLKQLFLAAQPGGDVTPEIFSTTQKPGAQFFHEVTTPEGKSVVPYAVMFQPEWEQAASTLDRFGGKIKQLDAAGLLPNEPEKNYAGLPDFVRKLAQTLRLTTTDPDIIYAAHQELWVMLPGLYVTCPFQISGLSAWIESGANGPIDYYLRFGYRSEQVKQFSSQAENYRQVCQKVVNESIKEDHYLVPPVCPTELLFQVGTGPNFYNQGDTERSVIPLHLNTINLVTQTRIALLKEMFDTTGIDMEAVKVAVVWAMCFHELMHQTPPVELKEISERLGITDIVEHTDVLDELRAETGVALLLRKAPDLDPRVALMAQISEFLQCVYSDPTDPVYALPAMACLDILLRPTSRTIIDPETPEGKYVLANAKGGLEKFQETYEGIMHELYLNNREPKENVKNRVRHLIDKTSDGIINGENPRLKKFTNRLYAARVLSPRLELAD